MPINDMAQDRRLGINHGSWLQVEAISLTGSYVLVRFDNPESVRWRP